MFGRRYLGGRYFGARYFGDGGAAAAVDGAYNGARYFGPRHFGPRYFSPNPPAGSAWDLESPIDTPISGTLAISGDFAFAAPFDVAETGPLALSGTLAISGEFAFSDAPINVTSGGGAFSRGARKKRKGIDTERLRIEEEDAMVLDCITALIAAELI